MSNLRRIMMCVAMTVTLLACVVPAWAAYPVLVDLGTVAGATGSGARNVDPTGAMVAGGNYGIAGGYQTGVYTVATAQWTTLPPGTGYGNYISSAGSAGCMNAAGDVVGYSRDAVGTREATLWTAAGGYSPALLGFLDVSHTISTATAINDSGVIVGDSDSLPFVYEGGVMTNLPLRTDSTQTFMRDINNAGLALGHDETGHILVYEKLGNPATWQITHQLPGTNSVVISEAGNMILVENWWNSSSCTPVMWTYDAGNDVWVARALPKLAGGYHRPYDLNAAGDVVGSYRTDVSDEPTARATYYRHASGVIYDLTDLLDPADSAVYTLRYAYGINNQNEICGTLREEATGAERGFLLNLNPAELPGPPAPGTPGSYADPDPFFDHGAAELDPGMDPVYTTITQQQWFLTSYDLFGYNPRYPPGPPFRAPDGKIRLFYGDKTIFVNAVGRWSTRNITDGMLQNHPEADAEPISRLDPYAVSDVDGDVYLIVQARFSGDLRYGLLHSTDNMDTWTFYESPTKVERLEHGDGHNDRAGPPPMVEGRGAEVNLVTTTKKPDGTLNPLEMRVLQQVVPPVATKGRGWLTPAHSGCGNVSITYNGKTHVVWMSIQPFEFHQADAEALSTANVGNYRPYANRPEMWDLTALAPCYVRTYDCSTGAVSAPALLGFTRRDNHNAPVITVDSNGYLHVVIGAHGDNFLYVRSTAPNDSANWLYVYDQYKPIGFVHPVNGYGLYTYTGLACDSSNTLHLSARHTNTGGYYQLVYLTKPSGTDVWPSTHHTLVSPFRVGYQAYRERLTLDLGDRLYINYWHFPAHLNAEQQTHYEEKWGSGAIKDEDPELIISTDLGANWKLALTEEINAPVTPELVVAPDSHEVTSSAGQTAFAVSNDGLAQLHWTAQVSSGQTWLSISDGTAGTDAGTITADYTVNATGLSRQGTITVIANGAIGSPEVVTVTQLPEPALWFEDTFESDSPAVQWETTGDYKYMSSSTHGIGTLSPLGGGYKVGLASPGDQLYKHPTCGSHFTGIAHGLWTAYCSYALLADPTNSKTGEEQARFDIKLLTVGNDSGITFYLGELSTPYSALTGTVSDMRAYGMIQFTNGSANKANIQLFDTLFPDAVDIDWNQTYQVIADFDVSSDTATLSVTDGTNVLVTQPGTVSTQMGASTMSAVNGWVCATTSGSGLGLDNFIFESAPTDMCGDVNHPYPIGDLDHDCDVDLRDVSIFSDHWLAAPCSAPNSCDGVDLDQSGTVDLGDFTDFAATWLDCTAPNLSCD